MYLEQILLSCCSGPVSDSVAAPAECGFGPSSWFADLGIVLSLLLSGNANHDWNRSLHVLYRGTSCHVVNGL